MKLCSIDGCGRKHYGNGLCEMHNARWWRTGSVEFRESDRWSPGKKCEFPGCPRNNKSRGLCDRHEQNLRLRGDILGGANPGPTAKPETVALWAKATPLVRADLRSAATMRELGRRKDVDFYLDRAATHGRPLTKLEREFADGVRMEADRERDQAVLAKDVQELTERGFSAEEIASMLGVSDRTVVRKRVDLGIAQPTGQNQHKE